MTRKSVKNIWDIIKIVYNIFILTFRFMENVNFSRHSQLLCDEMFAIGCLMCRNDGT